MTDPAVAYQPGAGYGTFDRGTEEGVFLKNPNGTVNLGVVWPGEQHVAPSKYLPSDEFR